MSLRLIIRTEEARIPNARDVHFRTIVVDLPEVEALLVGGGYNGDGTYLVRQLVGAEIIKETS